MKKLSLMSAAVILLNLSFSNIAHAAISATEAEQALDACTQSLGEAFKEPLARDRKVLFNFAFDVCQSHNVDINMAMAELAKPNTTRHAERQN